MGKRLPKATMENNVLYSIGLRHISTFVCDMVLFWGQVTHYGNFLDWLDQYFIPVLYNEVLYNGEGSTDYDQKFISSPYHFRLGHPSMRQLRVRQGTYLLDIWSGLSRTSLERQ